MGKSRRLFVIGGIVASVVLIAFGGASIVMGVKGIDEVQASLADEKIVGTPDSGSIAGKEIDTGDEAKQFAATMRKHTLAITDGKTYAEMGRYLTQDGTETDDESKAAKDPETGAPVQNEARNIWVTYTALTTALNMSWFAEQVAMFSILMGAALLITGIGFVVLTLGALRLPASGGDAPGAAA